MTLGKAFRLAIAWLVLGLAFLLLVLALSPELRAQSSSRLVWMHDGAGNALSSSLEGIYRSLAIVIIDPTTDAPITYVADSRAAGISDATTLRSVEATDSQLSAGVGATGDSATTAGAVGSLSSKLRLMTTQLDTMSTALASLLTSSQLIDDDQTGATPAQIITTASTNSTSVKASPGKLYALHVFNTTTTVYYFRLYNAASAPTCSSATNFVTTYPIPPASAAGQVGGFVAPIPPMGVALGTGFAYCVTGGPTSTDNTNAAVGVYGTAIYK